MRYAALTALVLVSSAPALAQSDGGTATAPAGWTCSATYYASDDGCDCGCGIVDPDCEDSTPESCGYSWCGTNSATDPADTTQCVDEAPPAEGWTCTFSYYGGDDGCDCGCGAPDPDCESDALSSCRYNYCEEGEAPTAADPTQCAPGAWTPPTDDGSHPVDDGHDDEEAPPTDDEEPAPPTGTDPQESTAGGGVDLEPASQTPTGNSQQPGAAGGCTATPGEPAVLGALLLAMFGLRGTTRRRCR